MSRVLETALALKPVQSSAFFIKFRTPSVEFDAIINNLILIGYDIVQIDFIGTLIGTIKYKYKYRSNTVGR